MGQLFERIADQDLGFVPFSIRHKFLQPGGSSPVSSSTTR
jgi:hypothetical protein